jgi:malate dehydrogenase
MGRVVLFKGDSMPKVTVIGSGNVGSDLARRILERDLADVTLIDIVEGLPQGRALDLTQAGAIEGYKSRITGTNDMSKMEGSDIVVMTAGLARKPGMSRDDLMFRNAETVGSVVRDIVSYAPNSIIIMVTNPLDIMTHLAFKKSGFDKKRVMGMAGVLDSARMEAFISMELNIPTLDIKAMILGSHGDLMVAALSQTFVKGRQISKMMPEDRLNAIVERTKNGGAEIVELLKTGSAYYTPAASTANMVQAVINDTEEEMPVCCYLSGEYGLNDVSTGVPALLGKNGIEEIVELKLAKEEMDLLHRSAASIKENIGKLSL